MHRFILFCLLLITATGIQAQHSIKGTLLDEKGEPLPSATIILTNSADSVLQGFTMSGSDGAFEIKKVPKGNYFMTANFLEYEQLKKDIEVDGSQA
ncbi:MAG: carboxypeptidase-like regulatory domain-containing protein, partial [Bacteroidota bacterium]